MGCAFSQGCILDVPIRSCPASQIGKMHNYLDERGLHVVAVKCVSCICDQCVICNMFHRRLPSEVNTGGMGWKKGSAQGWGDLNGVGRSGLLISAQGLPSKRVPFIRLNLTIIKRCSISG